MIAIISFGLLCACLTADASSWGNPCDLMPHGPTDKLSTVDVTVPAHCHNGTFDWNYPQGTINLHFSNPNGMSMSVCLRNDVGGDIFTVRDITGNGYTLMEIDSMRHTDSEKETCTPYHLMPIILSFQAPPTMYYMGAVGYRLKR